MGMYTGLRARVVVKPEWRPGIQLLHDVSQCGDSWNPTPWFDVYKKYPLFPGLHKWIYVDRASLIPFGGLAYMPDDFSDAEDGEGYSKFNLNTGVWQFCCSLKNYEGEIGLFIETVLRHIVDKVEYCESLYEEAAYGPDDGDDDSNWRKWTTKHIKELTT